MKQTKLCLSTGTTEHYQLNAHRFHSFSFLLLIIAKKHITTIKFLRKILWNLKFNSEARLNQVTCNKIRSSGVCKVKTFNFASRYTESTLFLSLSLFPFSHHLPCVLLVSYNISKRPQRNFHNARKCVTRN